MHINDPDARTQYKITFLADVCFGQQIEFSDSDGKNKTSRHGWWKVDMDGTRITDSFNFKSGPAEV